MAIAIRGGSPLVVATTSNPVSGTLTGSQQPQAGDLLVIIHGNDFFDLSNMVTPTVGGSTTGVTAVTNGVADAGSNLAHVKAYTYVVGSTGDLTVAATETGADGEEKMLVLYVLSGVDTTTPIDGGSAGAAGSFSPTGGSTLVLTGVTPSGSDAFLIAHLNTGGGSSAGPPYTPPGAPFTEQYDSSTGGIAYTGGAEQLSASGATGTRTFTSAGSGSWAGVVLAVKTAAVGAADPPQFSFRPPGRIAPGGRWSPWPGVPDAPTGATPVSLAESGTGTETASVAATVPFAEAGTGAENLAVAVPVTLAETGSGTESLTAGIAIGLADSGAGTDTLTVAAALTATDTGTATEALTTTAAVPLTQAGTGTDTLTTSAAVPLSETGTGTDNLTAGIAIPLADSGTGTESLTVQISIPQADSGTSSQTISVAALAALAEAGSSAQLLTIGAATPFADSGTGVETLTVLRPVTLADAGTGADSLTHIDGLPYIPAFIGVDGATTAGTRDNRSTTTPQDQHTQTSSVDATTRQPGGVEGATTSIHVD